MAKLIPNLNRRVRVLLIAIVLVVFGTAWWRIRTVNMEPAYNGRPLSYWLEEGREDFTNGSKAMPIRLNAESTAVVRAIGTNALPWLRKRMAAPKPGWRQDTYRWVHQRRFPPFVIWSASVVSGYDRYDPFASILAFQALERDAEAAVPFLTEMLGQDENSSMAVLALSVIRPEGVRALIEAFPRIADEEQRGRIVSYLEYAVSPDIAQTFVNFAAKWSTEDPSSQVRFVAVHELGTFTNSAAVAVPALTRALKDRDTWVRSKACSSLERFGKDAASASAPLGAALNDPHPQVRADAARALQAIGGAAAE